MRKMKRYEADEYLIAFTEDFGKIGVTGKSIRKIKSKLRSSSELFCYSDIEFISGRKYNILTDAETINSFSKIKKDLGKLSVGFRIAYMIASFLPEEEKDDQLWEFILKSFSLLEGIDLEEGKDKKEQLRSFYYYFIFKFLGIIGYAPEISNCLIDKKEGSVFSPREGGLVCELCSEKLKDPLKVKIKKEDKVFLEKIFELEFEEFIKEPPEFVKIGEVLQNYMATLPSRQS